MQALPGGIHDYIDQFNTLLDKTVWEEKEAEGHEGSGRAVDKKGFKEAHSIHNSI